MDCQYDFINGSLSVTGAEAAMRNLAEFIKEHAKDYDFIFLTADWHPASHCSFKQNGGIWPLHCVQHTIGASIYQPIIDALYYSGVDYDVLTKGDEEDREEYSVFSNMNSGAFLTSLSKNYEIKEIDICGLALDYCVKSTAEDAKRCFNKTNIAVLHEFSPAIGNTEETLKELDKNGIIIM